MSLYTESSVCDSTTPTQVYDWRDDLSQGVIIFFLISIIGLILYLLQQPNNIITPSNSSVWETTKLLYVPSLLIGLIVFLTFQPTNFVIPWILATGFAIYYYVTIYYTYLGIFGEATLYLEVSSYLYAVAIGVALYYYLRRSTFSPMIATLSIIAFVVFGLALIVLTYYHPTWGIFSPTSPNTTTY